MKNVRLIIMLINSKLKNLNLWNSKTQERKPRFLLIKLKPPLTLRYWNLKICLIQPWMKLNSGSIRWLTIKEWTLWPPLLPTSVKFLDICITFWKKRERLFSLSNLWAVFLKCLRTIHLRHLTSSILLGSPRLIIHWWASISTTPKGTVLSTSCEVHLKTNGWDKTICRHMNNNSNSNRVRVLTIDLRGLKRASTAESNIRVKLTIWCKMISRNM